MTESDNNQTYRQQQRAESKERRARNRKHGLEELRKVGVLIAVKNGGAHLIVKKGETTIDYYPGTGKWIVRKIRHGDRGLANLKQYLSQIEIPKL